ncbi:glycoside hydrolase, partial [Streptomyces spiralis]
MTARDRAASTGTPGRTGRTGGAPLPRTVAAAAATAALAATAFAAAPAQAAAPAHSAPPAALYTPPANPDADQQILDLVRHRQLKDAAGVLAMTLTPQAVWYGDGTPDEVRASVHKTVVDAA